MWQDIKTYIKEQPLQAAGLVLLLIFTPGKKFAMLRKQLSPVFMTYIKTVFRRKVLGRPAPALAR